MVTGAYFPELSGGGLQARGIIQALRDRVDFAVLTTSADRLLPSRSSEDGVPIRRVHVDIMSVWSTLTAGVRIAGAFLRSAAWIDAVNLHGFSRKAILLVALSRVFGKRFILTLQTGLHDEPAGVRATGSIAYWAYRHADLYLSVSPGLSRAYLSAGLPAGRLRQVSNAVDTQRFRPSTPQERGSLRRELGLPDDVPVVLFVGFFSRDKRPDVLFDAWAQTPGKRASTLVLVGATRSAYQEVDETLAETIRERAAARGLSDHLFFVEPTPAIDRYFRAADVYVLPSVREGLPIALLEAMASGVACIASRLPGSTDTLIDDEVNGLLVAPDDRDGFARAIARLVDDPDAAARFGAAARGTVVERYSLDRAASAWLAAYAEGTDAR
jgi:glycosyltransferase involved in cell wall biosynthesis